MVRVHSRLPKYKPLIVIGQGLFLLANLLIDKGKTGESSCFTRIISPDAHSSVLHRFRPYTFGQCPFSVYCAVYCGQAVHSRLTQLT